MVEALVRRGLTPDDARRRLWFVDVSGSWSRRAQIFSHTICRMHTRMSGWGLSTR